MRAATALAERQQWNDAVKELERAKAQILAECKAWLREQLQAARER